MENVKTIVWLSAVTLLLMTFNSYQMYGMLTGADVVAASTITRGVVSEIIPTGVPSWGESVGFSYDDIDPYDKAKADAAIRKLAVFDQTLELAGDNLQRYIKILYNDNGGISCEYCCGVRSIIAVNGQAACGCAHSFAMRGLAKYLITNFAEMKDEEILEEVGKLKVRFFPNIMEGKAQVMQQKGMDVDYLSLTTNLNRGIEKGQASGGMVGGC